MISNREFQKLSRENWWFKQMREVVDKALYEVNQTPASDGNITVPHPCAGSDASDNGETGGGNLKGKI